MAEPGLSLENQKWCYFESAIEMAESQARGVGFRVTWTSQISRRIACIAKIFGLKAIKVDI